MKDFFNPYAHGFVRLGVATPLVRIGLRMPASHDGWNAFLTKPFLMKDLYGAVDTALGSAKEVKAALEVAHGWGWLSEADATKPLAILDQLLAICWRLTHPK